MPDDQRPHKMSQILGGSLPGSLGSRLPGRELHKAWFDLTGKVVAAKARPVALERDGVLVVAVKGAMWRQELSFQAPELIQRLNERGLGLSRLKLVLDRSTPPPLPVVPEDPELDDREEEEALAGLARVEDPKLKEALAKVARQALRARKADHT